MLLMSSLGHFVFFALFAITSDLATPLLLRSSSSTLTKRIDSWRRSCRKDIVRTPSMLSEAFKMKKPRRKDDIEVVGEQEMDGLISSLCLDPISNVRVHEQKVFKSGRNLCLTRNQTYVLTWPLFQQVEKELCKIVAIDNRIRNKPMQNLAIFLTTKLVKHCLFTLKSNSKLSTAIIPLCLVPEKVPEMLWKVGSGLVNSPCGQPHQRTFDKKMKDLTYNTQSLRSFLDTTIRDMVLDGSSSNLHSIYSRVTGHISRPIFNADPYILLLYGHLEYLLWKQQFNLWRFADSNTNSSSYAELRSSGTGSSGKKQWINDNIEDEEEDEDDVFGKKQRHGNHSQKQRLTPPADMSYHGDRAMHYLKCVLRRTGTWDLVLPKYLEMASQNGGDTEVWDALKLHAGNNEDNHLAFVFQIAWNTKKKHCKMSEILHTYRKLADLNPTHQFVLTYIEFLWATDEPDSRNQAFDLLLKRLAHRDCIHSFPDWKLLFAFLSASQEAVSVFRDLIRSKTYWTKLNFPTTSPTSGVKHSRTEPVGIREEIKELKEKILRIIKLDPHFSQIQSKASPKNEHGCKSFHIPLSLENDCYSQRVENKEDELLSDDDEEEDDSKSDLTSDSECDQDDVCTKGNGSPCVCYTCFCAKLQEQLMLEQIKDPISTISNNNKKRRLFFLDGDGVSENNRQKIKSDKQHVRYKNDGAEEKGDCSSLREQDEMESEESEEEEKEISKHKSNVKRRKEIRSVLDSNETAGTSEKEMDPVQCLTDVNKYRMKRVVEADSFKRQSSGKDSEMRFSSESNDTRKYLDKRDNEKYLRSSSKFDATKGTNGHKRVVSDVDEILDKESVSQMNYEDELESDVESVITYVSDSCFEMSGDEGRMPLPGVVFNCSGFFSLSINNNEMRKEKKPSLRRNCIATSTTTAASSKQRGKLTPWKPQVRLNSFTPKKKISKK